MDYAWFSCMNKYYEANIRQIQGKPLELSIKHATLTYACLILGYTYFVRNMQDAMMYGFITYGVYNLTNLATLEDFDELMAFIDILWGTFVFSTIYYVMKN
jgi:uncharacterized membrane protein